MTYIHKFSSLRLGNTFDDRCCGHATRTIVLALKHCNIWRKIGETLSCKLRVLGDQITVIQTCIWYTKSKTYMYRQSSKITQCGIPTASTHINRSPRRNQVQSHCSPRPQQNRIPSSAVANTHRPCRNKPHDDRDRCMQFS